MWNVRNLKNKVVLALKSLMYGSRGEPYAIGGYTLRYEPGTRPIRVQYATSENNVARYDALQVRLFATALSEGDTVLDIGAHAGQYSIIMAAMVGRSGRVV